MKKGFTLIELMAVVIVLGVLALFVVPTIDKTMKQIREDGYEEQINNIKTAEKIGELTIYQNCQRLVKISILHY